MKELIAIQMELRAPKGRQNTFGNFRYRSAEDILEAVKPLLHKYNCLLFLSDDIIQIGERYFLKVTASFIAPDGKQIAVTAIAAHAFDRKGMDVAQMSGSASSYARKYALSGLFLLDDERLDPDSQLPQMNAVSPPLQIQPVQWNRQTISQAATAQTNNNPPPPPPAKR